MKKLMIALLVFVGTVSCAAEQPDLMTFESEASTQIQSDSLGQVDLGDTQSISEKFNALEGKFFALEGYLLKKEQEHKQEIDYLKLRETEQDREIRRINKRDEELRAIVKSDLKTVMGLTDSRTPLKTDNF